MVAKGCRFFSKEGSPSLLSMLSRNNDTTLMAENTENGRKCCGCGINIGLGYYSAIDLKFAISPRS